MAKTTASASGVKRYFAGPVRNTTETKTIQMASDLLRAVENRALDRFSLCEISVNVFQLDGGVVHQNANREREAAQRHHVEGVAEQA